MCDQPSQLQGARVSRRPCHWRCVRATLSVGLLTVGGACQRNSEGNTAAEPEPDKQINRVIFPDDKKVDDVAVNRFIADALGTCARGDYEDFRLLWSVRQDPLRREEFEQGWQAVQTIRVRAIERILLGPRARRVGKDAADLGDTGQPDDANDISYVLLAEADFDPEHPVGRRQSKRDFVLVVLREQGRWRFGRAPEAVRDWLKEHAATQEASRKKNASGEAAPTVPTP